jgi:hypothetical protein
VFAVGQLHDLRLRVHKGREQGKRFVAAGIEARRKPVATRISGLKGYELEQAVRLLEYKLRDLPCASNGSEVSFPIRLQTDASGCVSSVAVESKADDALVRCTEREIREWDLGYPSVIEGQGHRRGELSFVIVYPR